MPLAFLIIGVVLVVVAIRDTYAILGQLLADDFTGSGAGQGHSFLIWLAAIAAVGALGYIPDMKLPARLLLALVILALLISNKGVFAQAQQALGQTIPGVSVTQAQATPTESSLPAAFPVQVTGSTSSGSGGGPLGTISQGLGVVSQAATFFGGL